MFLVVLEGGFLSVCLQSSTISCVQLQFKFVVGVWDEYIKKMILQFKNGYNKRPLIDPKQEEHSYIQGKKKQNKVKNNCLSILSILHNLAFISTIVVRVWPKQCKLGQGTFCPAPNSFHNFTTGITNNTLR